MYEMFLRLAGADKEIDSEELQDLLTASVKGSGKIVSISMLLQFLFFPTTAGSGSSAFSLDACRAMIAMLDVSPCINNVILFLVVLLYYIVP